MSRRDKILRAIAAYWADQQFGPSLRDLTAATGVPLATLKREVEDARAAGLVAFTDRQPRTVRLTDTGRAHVQEPAGT